MFTCIKIVQYALFNVFSGLGLKQSLREEAKKAGMESARSQELVNSMARHLVQSKSDGTVTKYFSAFKRWESLIKSENSSLDAIPGQPIQVALYITHLIDSGCSVASVQAAIYCIKWAHKLRGLIDPTDNNYITNLLDSAKRKCSKPVVKKDIISTDNIVSLCDKYLVSTDILVLRDLAIIVICFAGFLRFDEITF